MKPVVVAKILQEALHTSWNFRSAHWLHLSMNVKKHTQKKNNNKNNNNKKQQQQQQQQIFILKSP